MVSKLSLSPFDVPSATLAHFNRVAGSTSGQDKIFMVYAYAAHLVTAALRSPRLANKTRLDLAERIEKLRGVISDARVLYRLFGLFPIIQWAQSLNDPATQPKDRQLLLIQRLQAWSMLLYYPLEHTYYLAGKGVFNIKPQRIGQMAIWSCRFWAAYVVLQIFHIRRSFSLLSQEKQSILRSTRQRIASGKHDSETSDNEKKQLKALEQKKLDLKNDCWVQAGYLPLTAHWSIPGGILPDNVWVGVCGTIAATAGLKGLWKKTA
ncbi:hypothetical protein JCM16303_002565 [Sporobolomyces ruberrimus]